MSDSLYLATRQTLTGLLLYQGLNMLLMPLPKKISDSFYQKSLRMMGIAFIFVPLSCFLYNPNIFVEPSPYVGAVVNLTAYYATFTTMALAFLTLLGKKYSKLTVSLFAIADVIFPLPAWFSLMSKNSELTDTVLTASYSYFVMCILFIVIHIIRNCNKVTKNIDNYYTDDVQLSTNWIKRSIWLLIGLSITCAISPLFNISPNWLRCIFLTYGVLCYFHIYYGFQRMMLKLIDIFVVNDHNISNFISIEQNINSDNSDNTLCSSITDKIEQQLDIWLSNKGYKQKGVTINVVANDIQTNRTYLSKYINTTYNCSFRNWITTLRIDEAERLLSSEIDLTINSIAKAVGFASLESFTHTFTRIKGVSPSKWRTECTELNTKEL